MENWQEYSKSAMASAKELEAINTDVIEKLTGKQMELANAAFETGTKYVNSLSEMKGYQELMAEQTKLVSEYNEKLIEAARSTADIVSEARESYQAWMEKNFKAITDSAEFPLASLVPTAPKKTTRKAA